MKPKASGVSRVAEFQALLNEGFQTKAWHGPTLRGSLRGVTAEMARWRPSAQAHNIWELVLHTAYWKSMVRGRISSARNSGFPVRGRNWFRRDDGSAAMWKREIDLLDEMHQRLLQTVKDLPLARLQEDRIIRELRGVALHDVYHAGQIGLLKKMYKDQTGA